MRKYTHNSLIAFFGGLFGVSIVFILFSGIPTVFHFENPFPTTFLGIFLYFLIVVSFVEEGTKFLFIKRDIGQYPYSLFLGLSFGGGEIFLRSLGGVSFTFFDATPIILLQTINAGIIGYFVYKKKPLIGLLIAMLIHTDFNLFLA